MAKLHFTSPSLRRKSGFTLIELSIVLVIIGLIVGGVLVGQDLIKAAETRAQISQIEKYNTAVRTFQGKYGYLPGDMPDPYATQFGFIARDTRLGQGDGNGILSGLYDTGNGWSSGYTETGEPLVFWGDLSKAGLIDGAFNTAVIAPGQDADDPNQVADFLPRGKAGNGLFVYVISGYESDAANSDFFSSNNFFSLSQVTAIGGFGRINGNTGLSVNQAYNIDKKTDDGLPAKGNVQAVSAQGDSSHSGLWFSNNDTESYAPPGGSNINASATTCYDNNNSTANPVTYSLSQNNGAGINCSLAFKFQ